MSVRKRPIHVVLFWFLIHRSAFDSVKNVRVAVKKLTRAFETVELAKRSYREIKILKHMDHENVCTVNLFSKYLHEVVRTPSWIVHLLLILSPPIHTVHTSVLIVSTSDKKY